MQLVLAGLDVAPHDRLAGIALQRNAGVVYRGLTGRTRDCVFALTTSGRVKGWWVTVHWNGGLAGKPTARGCTRNGDIEENAVTQRDWVLLTCSTFAICTRPAE